MAEEVKDHKAPGWKPDPSGRFAGRFWNGTQWTEHVVNRERVTSKDPIPYPPRRAARPVEPDRPAPQTTAGWPRWARFAVPLAVVVAIVVAVTSRGDDDPSPTAANNPATTVAAAPAKSLYAVGETATTGELQVTVFGSSDPQTPGPFLKPEEGKHFVSVEVEVANRGSRPKSFSSLLGFHLVDAEKRQFDTSFGEIKPEAPDGDLAPGEAKRGFVVFEVPDGTSGLRLSVQGNLAAVPVLFALS